MFWWGLVVGGGIVLVLVVCAYISVAREIRW